MSNTAWEIAELERELAERRQELREAEARLNGPRGRLDADMAPRLATDLLPLRDRIQLLKRKIGRLKARSW